jgi:hypothetical protein
MTLYSIASYGLQRLKEAYPLVQFEARLDKKGKQVVFQSTGIGVIYGEFLIDNKAEIKDFDAMVAFFY